MTPYASKLQVDQIDESINVRRKVLATLAAALVFSGVTVGMFYLLTYLMLLWVPIVVPLLLAAAAASYVLGARADVSRVFFSTWIGIFGACGSAFTLLVVTNHKCCADLLLLPFGLFVIGNLSGASSLISASIVHRLLRPLRRNALRTVRARRWMQLMPRPKLARVDRSDQGAALFLAPIGQIVFAFVLAMPASIIFGENNLVGLTCTFAAGALTGLLGAIGLGTDREFQLGHVIWPLVLVPCVLLPLLFIVFPWFPMPGVYLVVSTGGVWLGAWLTAIAMLRKRNGVYA